MNLQITKCYDAERNTAKQYETKRGKTLIVKGKKYLAPPRDGSDFKELFLRMANAGAGRPVDSEGFPPGPWTAELLADAISQFNANSAGVELRTVQHWFQENDKGISVENIRWLARIFGCGDLDATSAWQAELKASQLRLTAKRKEKRRIEQGADHRATDALPTDQRMSLRTAIDTPTSTSSNRVFSIARSSEALFSGLSLLNLPASVWAGWVVLGFLAYIMGVHSVTYSPTDGLLKQVGYFWAPNWTLLELVILPLFLVTVVGLLAYWKGERRFVVSLSGASKGKFGDWDQRVESFSASHWAVFLICFVIVFLVQWSGVHMSALANGDAGNLMMDWNLLAIVRPEIISVSEATVLSMLAFLYTAFICFLFLTGLVLTCTLVQDFYEICSGSEFSNNDAQSLRIGEVGTTLLCQIYRASLFGIWIATCIKLQAMYLLSDGQNILSWLLTDFQRVLGITTEASGSLDNRALAHFSSFLLLFSTCFVFAFSLIQISRVLQRTLPANAVRQLMREQRTSRRAMLGVVGLLVANFFLVGHVAGFSVLLVIGILITIYSLYEPMIGRAQFNNMTTSKS